MPTNNADWISPLSEPVRARSRVVPRHLGFYVPNFTFFGFGGDVRLAFFRPLSEPVRAKRPLPNRNPPYLFLNVPQLSYRFALSEQGDSGAFSISVFPPKNLAQVTITEVKAETQVTMNNIVYHRGYS